MVVVVVVVEVVIVVALSVINLKSRRQHAFDLQDIKCTSRTRCRQAATRRVRHNSRGPLLPDSSVVSQTRSMRYVVTGLSSHPTIGRMGQRLVYMSSNQRLHRT